MKGRKPKHTSEQRAEIVKFYKERTVGQKEFCKAHGISLPTLYKYMKELKVNEAV